MGKTLKTLGTFAAIVGISFIPGINILAASLIVSAAVNIHKAATQQKLEVGTITSNRRSSVQFQVINTNRSLPVVYGKTHMAGTVIDVRPKSDDLYTVIAYCLGPAKSGSTAELGIGAIGDIKLDGKVAQFADGTYASPFSNSNLVIERHLGESTQSADFSMSLQFSEWTSAHQGQGIAYTVARYRRRRSATVENQAYTGFPGQSADITGSKILDIRTGDQIVSSNPAICLYDYLTNDIYGAGVQESEINTGSFIDEANFCDQVIQTSPGGPTQTRFTCNGVLDTGNTIANNVAEILTSCRGQLIDDGGKLRLLINKAVITSSIAFNTDNIVGDWVVNIPKLGDKKNVMNATYVDASRNYQPNSVIFPSRSADFQFLENDGGFISPGRLDLPFTDNHFGALQIAMVILRESRRLVTAQFIAKEDALLATPGSVINITHEFPGWTNKPFRIVGMAITSGDLVHVTVQEYDEDIYDLTQQFDDDDIQDTELPDAFFAPPPDSVTLSSGTGSLVGKCSWTAATGSFIDHFEVEARHTTNSGGDNIYSPISHPDHDRRTALIPGVDQGQVWQTRVRQVNSFGQISDFVESNLHTMQLHTPANPTFATPIPTSGSIIYGFTFGDNVSRIDIYSRQHGNAGGADPLQDDNYLAYSVLRDASETSKEMATVEGNYRRTILVSRNLSDERGADSGILETQTLTASLGISPDGAPVDLTSTFIDGNSIDISWETGSNAVDLSHIFVDGLHVATNNYPGLRTLSLENVINLVPLRAYVIKVRDVLNSNLSFFSTAITRTTSGSVLDTPIPRSAFGGYDGDLGEGFDPDEFPNIRVIFIAGDNAAAASHTLEVDSGGGFFPVVTTSPGQTEFVHQDNSKTLNGVTVDYRIRAFQTGFITSAYSIVLPVTYFASTFEGFE